MNDSQTDSQTKRQTSDSDGHGEVFDYTREFDGADSSISPEIAETASRLRLVVTRTARKMRQEAGGDLTPTSMVALATIERSTPLTPTELARIEDVSRPTITRVINNLLEREMIRRDPDPRDGRSCLLTPTEAGRAYLAERRSLKSAYMAEMLSTLDPDQVETLSRAAAILDAALLNRARNPRVQESENFGVRS